MIEVCFEAAILILETGFVMFVMGCQSKCRLVLKWVVWTAVRYGGCQNLRKFLVISVLVFLPCEEEVRIFITWQISTSISVLTCDSGDY